MPHSYFLRFGWIVLAGIACADPSPEQAGRGYPVIDMHLHSLSADGMGPVGSSMCMGMLRMDPWTQEAPLRDPTEGSVCEQRVSGAATNDILRDRTFEVLERQNIIAVTSGPNTAEWQSALPNRIIPGILTSFRGLEPAALSDLIEDGTVEVVGEITTQYLGSGPSEPEFDPFFQVAAEHGIPVGIHMGFGPPGSFMFGMRVAAGNPLALEELLARYPMMRVYVMHAGWPFADEMIGMMNVYPQLYVGLGLLPAVLPRAEFLQFLSRLVGAGMGKRILFGSDQMVWPELIEYQIAAIESVPFLTEEQKRDILFENARTFLRLSDDPRLLEIWGDDRR